MGSDEEADHERKLTDRQSALASAEQHAHARFRARQATIQKAHAHARQKAFGEIDREEDKRKYLVQKGILDSEREEKNLLDGIEIERKSFEKELAEQQK